MTTVSVLLHHVFFPPQEHERVAHCHHQGPGPSDGCDEDGWVRDALGGVPRFPLGCGGLRSAYEQRPKLLTCTNTVTAYWKPNMGASDMTKYRSANLGSGTLAAFGHVSPVGTNSFPLFDEQQ